jgi:hypothetical protein
MHMIIPKDSTPPLGKATVTLDCKKAEAVAWFWDFCSKQRLKASQDAGDAARFEVSSDKANDKIIATIKQFPPPLRARELVFRMVWGAAWQVSEQRDDERLFVASESLPASLQVDYGEKISRITRGYVQCECKRGGFGGALFQLQAFQLHAFANFPASLVLSVRNVCSRRGRRDHRDEALLPVRPGGLDAVYPQHQQVSAPKKLAAGGARPSSSSARDVSSSSSLLCSFR